MVLRNAALLITNDNGQGIMETIMIVTGVLGFVMMMVALLCSVGLFIDKTPTDTQMYWFAGTFVALTLVYPVWRVIRRIVRCSRLSEPQNCDSTPTTPSTAPIQ